MTLIARLSLLHAVVNGIISYFISAGIGTVGTSAVWDWWAERIPEAVAPALFAVVAFLGILGGASPFMARLSFYWGAVLMGMWAVVALATGNPTGGIFLLYVGVLKIGIAELGISAKREAIRDAALQSAVHDACGGQTDASSGREI